MGRYIQLVIGPAGNGKSTYCSYLYEHCFNVKRCLNIANLDPAAEKFDYPVAFDVRNLITLNDVMEELRLGPNGGLLYCMEFMEDNIEDWLTDELEGYGDGDYLIFDCPGEIELYSHLSVFRTLVSYLQRNGWHVCAVYVLDSHFVTDAAKLISATIQVLSAMVHLEIPHINLLTKMDLCPMKQHIQHFFHPEGKILASELTEHMGTKYKSLNNAVGALLDNYSLVSFIPLDITSHESLEHVLSQVDIALLFGEDEEVRCRDFADNP
jgi:hypothetical protein